MHILTHDCTCRLVSPDILRLVHNGARMVYVGKQKGFHTRTQDEIHELLCHFALEGSSVLRLKGGDPFVFGRGGEEVQYLQQRNIKTHVIPGACFISTPFVMHVPLCCSCKMRLLQHSNRSEARLPCIRTRESRNVLVDLTGCLCSNVLFCSLGCAIDQPNI